MESANNQNGDLDEKETPDVSLNLDNKGMNSGEKNKATSYLYDLEITENDTESNSSFGDFDSESFWDNDSTSKESSSITNIQKRELAGSFLNEESKDSSEVIRNDEKQIFKTEEKKHNKPNDHDISVSPISTDNSEISSFTDESHRQSFAKEKTEDLKISHNSVQSNKINIDQPKEGICKNQKEDLGQLKEDELTETNITQECTEKHIQNDNLESEKISTVKENIQSSSCSDNLKIDEKIESTKLKCESKLSVENTSLDKNNFKSMKITNEDKSTKADDKSYLNNQLDINERVNGNGTENKTTKNESDTDSIKDTDDEDDSFGKFDTDEKQFYDFNDSDKQNKQESLNQNYDNVNTNIENHVVKSVTINKNEELTDFDKKVSVEADGFANFVDDNMLESDGFADFDDGNMLEKDGFADFDDSNMLEKDGFADFDDENFSTNDGFGSFSDGVKSENNELQKFDDTDKSFGNFSNAGSDQFGDFEEDGDGFDDFDDKNFENFNDEEINVEKSSDFSKSNKFKVSESYFCNYVFFIHKTVLNLKLYFHELYHI